MATLINSLKTFFFDILFKLLDFLASRFLKYAYGKPIKVPPVKNPLLLESAMKLASKIRKGQLKSVKLVQVYIERIKEVQPVINAVVDQRFNEALAEAKAVDELVLSGKKSEEELANETPFLGIPFTCKEAIGVKGLHLSCGLVSRKDCIAEQDAEAVAEMRKAGAIPLAVTNVPELCFWSESSNNIYGITRNPYDTSKTPAGSSGGEGALIGSAGSVIGIGNDIGGSIRLPSFNNGIFGHKPSTGIVSNKGQYPLHEGERNTFNCTGPMCRYSEDLLPMLKVLTKNNSHKLKLDTNVDLKRIRIFSCERGGGLYSNQVHPEIKNGLKSVVNHLVSTYGIQHEKIDFKELSSSFEMWGAKFNTAKGVTFAEEMAGRKGRISLPLEIMKWCLRCSEHTLHALTMAFFEHFAPRDYTDILKLYDQLKEKLTSLLQNDGILLYPTQPVPPQFFHQSVYRFPNVGYTAIFNLLGFPSTHIPLGLTTEGLPFGIQAVGNIHNDHLTLAIARELEKTYNGWKSPSFIL